MVIVISKNMKPSQIRKLLSSKKLKASKEILDSFFGKLPEIEDGLTFQKRIRNQWE
jgi:hypothetical protein